AARDAGAPVVPGTTTPLQSVADAIATAEEIGYPVMLKAAAGGGGKGMRLVRSRDEFSSAFELAQSEAATSFKAPSVYLEKFIERPRHIEIQLIGDRFGQMVYLGERECSLQRRHQKVVEECPSPIVDEDLRRLMGEAAVRVARSAGYYSAGTIEFLVDRQRNFYFLEMNTRLQVEHPVTELVTGLDLVELMIRIAAGEKLPFRQDDVRQQGWAIETRVYAEDPTRNFLPSIGRLVRYRPPEGESVRIDSGVFEGAEISLYYDPMIAKLIVYGADREAAIGQLQDALDGFYISGVRHNVAFLGAIAASERFRAGALSTDFIAEIFPAGFIPPAEPVAADRAILIAAVLAEL